MEEREIQKIEYFKEKIKGQLSLIRDDIGEHRYNLYILMVESTDDYEELRELAEFELQLDMLDYTRNEISKPLKESNISIKELRKEGEIKEEGERLSSEEIIGQMNDEAVTDAMAYIMHMNLMQYSGGQLPDDSEDSEDDNDDGYFDESEDEGEDDEEIEDDTDEEDGYFDEDIGDEERDALLYGDHTEIGEANEEDERLLDDYYTTDESIEGLDAFSESEDEEDIEDGDNYFDVDEDTESSTEDKDEEDIEDGDDYFDEDDEDGEEEIGDNTDDGEDDGDDYFDEDDEDDYNEDDGEKVLTPEERYLAELSGKQYTSYNDDSDDDDDDYFDESEDEYDEETTSYHNSYSLNEDEEDEDGSDYFGDYDGDEESEDNKEESLIEDDLDDYFSDDEDEEEDEEEESSLFEDYEYTKETKDKAKLSQGAAKKRDISPKSIFLNETERGKKTQQMLNVLCGIGSKTAKAAVRTATKTAEVARTALLKSKFTELPEDEDDDEILDFK